MVSTATEAFAVPDRARDAVPQGRLALCFEEPFTVTVRLRREEQRAGSADAFRRNVKNMLVAADQEARDAGYEREMVRLAVYAFVAFLDESVLNSPQEMFSDWPRRPLQEEVFGDHRAGETFFRNLRDLLSRPDSPALADVLEVYLLCLMLGYRGRYGSGSSGELRGLVTDTREKIRRIRGGDRELSPSWRPTGADRVGGGSDPWVRRLLLGAAACGGLALLLLVIFLFVGGAGVDEVRAAAGEIVG
jgi:type VI secretion system protein ImpK